MPPSMASMAPLMNAASSESRKAAACATSSGVPLRRSGMFLARCSYCSGVTKPSVAGVGTLPGATGMLDQIANVGSEQTEILFSTGVDFGDGRQASHWKDNLNLGIMDPTAAPGELLVLRPNDLRAMDLIGYEIQAVPEAGSLTLLVIGSVLSLLVRQSR